MKFEIFPAIDLKDGKVVRLVQGDYQRQIDYSTEPEKIAGQFADSGAEWIHVVDLDGAKTGIGYNFSTFEKISKATGVKLQIGGGVRSEETIRRLLDAGATRVIIGTRGMEDWEWFHRTVHEPAFQKKIVFGLDAKNGILASHGWTKETNLPATDIAKKVSDWPLAAIVYTDIAKDGMMQGPNVEQVQIMAGSTKIPVIASGGVSSLDDVKKLMTLPLAGAIIGRAFYEGKIDLKEAILLTR